jgi:hypothetical protein
MGIIVRLLGSSLGMASEAIQYVGQSFPHIHIQLTSKHLFRHIPHLAAANSSETQRLPRSLSFEVCTGPVNRIRNCFGINVCSTQFRRSSSGIY